MNNGEYMERVSIRLSFKFTFPQNQTGGKKNLLGFEAMKTVIGLGCARMGPIGDHYMTYKVHGWESPIREIRIGPFCIDDESKKREDRVCYTKLRAPFNGVIAPRGLIPLYVSVGSRWPFLDNTFDIVHSTLFLDGWVGIELLPFVLFDWDRVLRPKVVICKEEDKGRYLSEFDKLGYRKLLWRVVPKTERGG
ncbi:S-adenosyl-L-methionine-dependent methyltransferases superfamily protein [Actinidia rufa]|uniref:S-adenosyl-L-methionine-dependent methyltransferases superfamily protein n=1 Tax=Actinidia rufa TaxID=165716 RepID=A0A7J0H7Y0_9ERIC|nr:S-adenosyl-L-methionine-dependent methyltransferases superfamily protein [Actinidia rufa]